MPPKREPQSGELERFLLDNAMHMEVGSPEGDTVRRIEWLKEWWVPILAIVVAVATLLAIVYLHEGVLRSLSEAIFLAAVLTVTVDPFLKKRLQKDVAQDIFHHLLGIDFPVEIRDAFQTALFSEKNYRKDVDIEAVAQRISINSVVVEVAIRSRVIAVRDGEYEQMFASEESENAEIVQASVTSDSKASNSYNYSKMENSQVPELALKPKKDEPMVFEWKAPKKIPMRKGESLSTYFKFTVKRGINDFFTYNFGSPTIHPCVRIRATADLTIHASWAEQINGNEYKYGKVFLPGDHIQIRWKPKLSSVVTNSQEAPALSKCDLTTPPPSRE
jgi:hypothetical protein